MISLECEKEYVEGILNILLSMPMNLIICHSEPKAKNRAPVIY